MFHVEHSSTFIDVISCPEYGVRKKFGAALGRTRECSTWNTARSLAAQIVETVAETTLNLLPCRKIQFTSTCTALRH
jgi:hypothetical protein